MVLDQVTFYLNSYKSKVLHETFLFTFSAIYFSHSAMYDRLLNWVRREWPSLLVIGLGVAIQMALITRSLSYLITTVLPDDAFYYFDIARSIVAGHGSTFNGIDPTNGFHPLWLLVLLPIFKFFYTTAADITPIRIVLLLAVVLNTMTALFVLRILARFSKSRWVRSLGMIVWMLNPFLLYETLNGLETALALCVFSIFVLLALRNEEGSSNSYWLTGLVGGFMVLARIDMVFYLAAYGAWLLFRKGWREWKHELRTAFTAGCFAAIPIVPWFVWNVLNFHMLLTGAAGMESMVNHQLIIQDHGPSFLQLLKAVVYNTQYSLNGLFQLTGMLSIAFAAIGAAVTLVMVRMIIVPKRIAEFTITHYLFLGFLVLFIADASIRWTVRSWYFVSFEIFLAILFVVVADTIFRHITHKRLWACIIVGLMLFSFYVDWSKNIREQFASQSQMYAAAQWESANLPAGSSIGVFNAGIQEYFSSRIIVDLDGLVNNNVFGAMQRRSLWQYIKSDKITYIADFDQYITYRYKSFFGIPDPFANLALIYNIGDATTTMRSINGLNIYTVK